MAAFVAKQMVGNKLNAVKGKRTCKITFKILNKIFGIYQPKTENFHTPSTFRI